MPQHAFVPGQIAEAEGRSFRNFRPRQVRGLLLGIAGGLLGAFLFGTSSPGRCAATFAMALPGFGYGFFAPSGKPIEYWIRVWLHYELSPRIALGARRRVSETRRRASETRSKAPASRQSRAARNQPPPPQAQAHSHAGEAAHLCPTCGNHLHDHAPVATPRRRRRR